MAQALPRTAALVSPDGAVSCRASRATSRASAIRSRVTARITPLILRQSVGKARSPPRVHQRHGKRSPLETLQHERDRPTRALLVPGRRGLPNGRQTPTPQSRRAIGCRPWANASPPSRPALRSRPPSQRPPTARQLRSAAASPRNPAPRSASFKKARTPSQILEAVTSNADGQGVWGNFSPTGASASAEPATRRKRSWGTAPPAPAFGAAASRACSARRRCH